MIHTGDCLDVLPTLESESVDAIVTDPPAAVSFMNKKWDSNRGGRTEWVAWMTAVMRECYRVLKPGGYAVVWSLPRTCHWTGWAMEDAGFFITDQLAHIFAQGFPKGRTQLKPAREDWWLARKPGPLRPLNIEESRIPSTGGGGDRNGEQSADRRYSEKGGTDLAPLPGPRGGDAAGRWPSNVLLSSHELFDEPNPWVVGSGATATSGELKPYHENHQNPTSYGFERDKTYTSKANSGGYSRFFKIPDYQQRAGHRPTGDGEAVADPPSGDRVTGTGGNHLHIGGSNPQPIPGDECDDCRDYPSAFLIPKADRADREPVLRGQLEPGMVGGRSRADGRQWDIPGSTLDNNKPKRENTHATVKPVPLMRHLIRLVTPPGGTVLDPFLGSGTTAIAAELEGFPWIGIEREPEYVAIAEARLNGTQRGLGLDVPAPTTQKKPSTSHWPARRTPHKSEGWGFSSGQEGLEERFEKPPEEAA